MHTYQRNAHTHWWMNACINFHKETDADQLKILKQMDQMRDPAIVPNVKVWHPVEEWTGQLCVCALYDILASQTLGIRHVNYVCLWLGSLKKTGNALYQRASSQISQMVRACVRGSSPNMFISVPFRHMIPRLSLTVAEWCAAILALSQSFMRCKHVSHSHGRQQKVSYPTSLSDCAYGSMKQPWPMTTKSGRTEKNRPNLEYCCLHQMLLPSSDMQPVLVNVMSFAC